FTATAADAENDALTFAATGVPTGATFSAAGVFSWTSAVAGTYTVSVTASDGAFTSAARAVTITVRANTAPTVAAITNPSVRAGQAVNFTATGTDPENDPLTFSATGVPSGATFSTAGVFSWPNATPVGSYAVSITASDGSLFSAPRTVTITVTANTAPTVNAITDPSVRAGQAVTFTATGTDAEGDALTFAATGVPTGATFSTAGVFSWPTAVAGTYIVSITASDGVFTSAARTVTITVRANTAPTVDAVAARTVRVGQSLTFNVTGADPESDALTFAATGVPTGATFSAAGVFIWANATPTGTYTLSITASDGVFTSAARAVTVTVSPNTAPTLGAIANQTTRAGQALTFSVPASDVEGDPLTVSMTGLPTGATSTVVDNAAVFSWPVPVAGSYTVTVSASDGLLTTSRQIGITVTPNTAPTVTAVPAQTVRAGAPLTFTVTGTDPENDALTFAATALPTGATLSTAGVFNWSSATPAGTYSISVTASDGVFTSAPRTVAITVRANTAPTVATVRSFTVRLQEAVNLTITGTDPENDAITFAATGLPTGAALSSAGVLTWSSASPGGDYTISVTASDGLLTSAPMTFTITVTNRSTDPGGGGGSMDLLGLALFGLWGVARVRRRRLG
ncbi:MAG: putative Ig domain-containing protein, partial [Gammaproteobacteria bacterium]